MTFGRPGRLKKHDLSKVFKRYASHAGIQKKVTPHTLRHTFSTIMINNGCDIRHIQQILGHANIDTTAKYYLGMDKKAVKAAHNRYLKY